MGVIVSGGGKNRVFEVGSGVTASLSGLIITGGAAPAGAGLYNDLGTVTLSECTLSGNSATSTGGGLDNEGTVMLDDCTISGNSAGTSGGGLDNEDTATLTDCTVSGNSASAGGGVSNEGSVTLSDCTLSANSATTGGGLGTFRGTVTLTGTIVAGNTLTAGGASDIGGGTVSGSDNLIGTGGAGRLSNGVAGNLVGVASPMLRPWATTAGRQRPWRYCPEAPRSARVSPFPGLPPTSAGFPSTHPQTSAPFRPAPWSSTRRSTVPIRRLGTSACTGGQPGQCPGRYPCDHV